MWQIMLKLFQRLTCNLKVSGYIFIDLSELYFDTSVPGEVECFIQ